MDLGNYFVDLTQKIKATKAKISKKDSIELKSFYTAKEINKTERQPTKREKIFANHLSVKGLMFRIYRKNSYKATNNSKNEQSN